MTIPDSWLLVLEHCPKCGSKEVQRSHRKNLGERAVSFLVLPWRCGVCYARFFRPRWVKLASRAAVVPGQPHKPNAARKAAGSR